MNPGCGSISRPTLAVPRSTILVTGKRMRHSKRTRPFPKQSFCYPGQTAFTLLEVLVALAVLALALGALIQAGAGQARAVDHLRTRTFADWVAADQLARARLADDWPDTGARRGETRMGNREWHWRLTVSGTDEPDIRRLEIAVRLDPNDPTPVTTLAGFIGRH